jgi:threonine dehydratase
MTAVTAEDVQDAAERIRGYAVRTPTLRDRVLSELIGGEVFVKCENLQMIGAFKYRGAFNRLARLSAAERRRGVVAWSAGNHAQGVAAAGRQLGVACTIVMPSDAPRVKIDRTRDLGASIVFYDRSTEDREAIAAAIIAESGATAVPPFDDLDVIAGQGTVGLELSQDVRALIGGSLDDVVVPCCGGGLLSGVAVALADADPGARLFAAEPAGYDSVSRSLLAGELIKVSGSGTICDALVGTGPGEITWSIMSGLVAAGIAVVDDDVLRAVRHAWSELRLVVEPGGAIALAAVLSDPERFRGRRVGVVLSGGNVDRDLYLRALNPSN